MIQIVVTKLSRGRKYRLQPINPETRSISISSIKQELAEIFSASSRGGERLGGAADATFVASCASQLPDTIIAGLDTSKLMVLHPSSSSPPLQSLLASMSSPPSSSLSKRSSQVSPLGSLKPFATFFRHWEIGVKTIKPSNC